MWSNDPESYAAGRASHARHVNGDDPDKTGYPGRPIWGLGHEAEAKKKFCRAAKSEIWFRISNIINQNILSSFYLVKKYGTQGIFRATDIVLYINV